MRVLIMSYGLFGSAPVEPSDQAHILKKTVAEVAHLKVEAEHLLAILIRGSLYT